MIKGYISCFILFFAFLLVGCQESEDHKDHQVAAEEEVKIPKVEIIADEQVNKNEDVPIAANVYYGKELVDDAEVIFEIKLGEQSEKVEAKLIGNGEYKIDYQFKEDGTYSVTAHTNVKSYHTMPTKDIVVGSGTNAKETTNEPNEGEHHHEEKGNEEHHSSSVTIKVDELTGFKVNNEETLSTNIEEAEQPFTEATVRFEIWKDGEEKHEYVEATEFSTKGEYTASYTFEEAGNYTVKVHVEKEEVHAHIETSFEVQ